MRYRFAQLRLTEEEFITVKKAALDMRKSLGDFLKIAVLKFIADSNSQSVNTQGEEKHE